MGFPNAPHSKRVSSAKAYMERMRRKQVVASSPLLLKDKSNRSHQAKLYKNDTYLQYQYHCCTVCCQNLSILLSIVIIAAWPLKPS